MTTFRQKLAVLAMVAAFFPALAFAGASSLVVKDGNGSSQTLSQYTDAANSSYLMGAAILADPTNGYKAAVKTASTAAAAADPALVVSVSPNSGVMGQAADAATAAGNPVQMGGVYTTSPSTLTTGQAGAVYMDAAHNVYVRQAVPTGGNPCLNPNATLATFYGATSGTSLTQIIALSGSTKIYICGASITGTSGTNPTITFSYGTGSNCGTGTQAMTGAIATTANVQYTLPYMVTPAGQALCYTGGGTTPVQQIAITYVQL